MRRTTPLAAALAGAAGMLAAAPWSHAQTAQPVPPVVLGQLGAAQVGQSPTGWTDPISVLQRAPDPSALIDAYARARAAGVDQVSVEAAYTRRMVELGLPEMAETQARDLAQQDPQNALAWAVQAYMSAKRDQTAAAITQIAAAVQRDSRDPFIQRTAGQIAAWYDTAAVASDLPVEVRQQVDAARTALAGIPGYEQAYAAAKQQYIQARQQTAAGDQPSGPAVASDSGSSTTTYSSPRPYPYTGSYPPYSYPTYAYPVYAGPTWYYPSVYEPWPWWPIGASVVITGGHFGHSHGFSEHRFDRGLHGHVGTDFDRRFDGGHRFDTGHSRAFLGSQGAVHSALPGGAGLAGPLQRGPGAGVHAGSPPFTGIRGGLYSGRTPGSRPIGPAIGANGVGHPSGAGRASAPPAAHVAPAPPPGGHRVPGGVGAPVGGAHPGGGHAGSAHAGGGQGGGPARH